MTVVARLAPPVTAAAATVAAVSAAAYGVYQQYQLELNDKAVAMGHLPTMESAQRTRVVRVPNLLSDDDIASVHALHSSMSATLGHASARDRGSTASSYKTGAAIEPELKPGWSITYLNTDGTFAAELPALRAKILSAARRAADAEKWGVLEAATEPVVPRCIEYHVVVPPGALPQPYHNDEGSAITVDVMLSPRSAFTGGEFSTLESSGEMVEHSDFEKGDALVFLSHKPHCVSPVLSGERRVLVTELWEGTERRCGHRCERHWMACSEERSGR